MASKDQTAQYLADAHFSLDQGTLRIFRLLEQDETNDLRPVKLLEVNSMTPEVGVSPIGFSADPSHGILYSSVIIELSPTEFDQFVAGQLKLPQDWQLGTELFRRSTLTKAAS
jgi:hypothetical protein